MRLSEVYEKSADAIERYGHKRGDYGSPDEGMCVLGAMHSSVGTWPSGHDGPLISATVEAAAERLAKTIDCMVYEWSDTSDTQEVLDTLRKAAKEARLEEEGLAP